VSKVPVTVISYKQNAGKGNAVRLGMLESKSDYTLFFDADMSTPLSEINKFLPKIKDGVNVVVGTRKNGHSTVIEHQPLYRELLGKAFTKITQISLATDVTDFTCGFKAFSKKATNKIFSKAKIDGWGYDAEIIFLAKKNRLSLNEVAVTWANDARTKVALRSAIINTLFELIKIRYYHSIKPAVGKMAFSSFDLNLQKARVKVAVQN
jgi:dolichyl-phosphate beta-glucosyltransferase